jgi:hypothetical protein
LDNNFNGDPNLKHPALGKQNSANSNPSPKCLNNKSLLKNYDVDVTEISYNESGNFDKMYTGGESQVLNTRLNINGSRVSPQKIDEVIVSNDGLKIQADLFLKKNSRSSEFPKINGGKLPGNGESPDSGKIPEMVKENIDRPISDFGFIANQSDPS